MSRKPKGEAKVRRLADLGALHSLLISACPPNGKNVKSIPVLAAKLRLTSWSVYGWINNDCIPPDRAKQIVDLKQPGVKIEDFYPFIFKKSKLSPKKRTGTACEDIPAVRNRFSDLV